MSDRGHEQGSEQRPAATSALAIMVLLLIGTFAVPGAQAQYTFTALYDFQGTTDGGNPWAGVIADSAGNLYGIAANDGAYGHGAVFEVTPSGQETVLYSFCPLGTCR